MIRYAITNLRGYSEDPHQARRLLRARVAHWIRDGIDVIQLREKHLGAAQLLEVAEDLLQVAAGSRTRVLINSRVDVAVAAGAHGVHLPSDPEGLHPEQVRAVFAAAGRERPMISASCHTLAEVERAARMGVDYILFGPVFEKRLDSALVQPGVGLEALRAASAFAEGSPVLALGGISRETIGEIVETGAAGVAGIRLFA